MAQIGLGRRREPKPRKSGAQSVRKGEGANISRFSFSVSRPIFAVFSPLGGSSRGIVVAERGHGPPKKCLWASPGSFCVRHGGLQAEGGLEEGWSRGRVVQWRKVRQRERTHTTQHTTHNTRTTHNTTHTTHTHTSKNMFGLSRNWHKSHIAMKSLGCPWVRRRYRLDLEREAIPDLGGKRGGTGVKGVRAGTATVILLGGPTRRR